MQIKVCCHCKVTKSIAEFARDNRQSDGAAYRCRECTRLAKREAYAKNQEHYLEYARKQRQADLDKYRKWDRARASQRRSYYQLHPRPPRKKQHIPAAQQPPNTRLAHNMRGRIQRALRGKPCSQNAFDMIGCSRTQLVAHIESQWQSDMSWENYGHHGGHVWHVDHIRPCASFDLTDPEQQKACFHWSNLQPLWAGDNHSKSDKMIRNGKVVRGRDLRPIKMSWGSQPRQFATPPPWWKG